MRSDVLLHVVDPIFTPELSQHRVSVQFFESATLNFPHGPDRDVEQGSDFLCVNNPEPTSVPWRERTRMGRGKFDEFEWRGEKFKLKQKYLDYEEYKSDNK